MLILTQPSAYSHGCRLSTLPVNLFAILYGLQGRGGKVNDVHTRDR